jgi:hypothetical protein
VARIRTAVSAMQASASGRDEARERVLSVLASGLTGGRRTRRCDLCS